MAAFLPLVNCEYSGDVRSTASQCLSQLFKSSCLAASDGGASNADKALCQKLFPVLAKTLTKQLSNENDEDEIENRDAIADALSEVFYDAFSHETASGDRVAQVTAGDSREIVGDVISMIKACLSRRAILLEVKSDVVDEDEIARCEEKAQAEAELLTHLVDSIGYQLKSLGEGFGSIFADFVAGTLSDIITSGNRDV